MTKLLFLFLGLTFFSLTSEAAIYKGQKEFAKHCIKCHKSAQSFIAKYTMDEWKNIMKNDGTALAQLHLKNHKAKSSWKYFKSDRYKKKQKHIRQFLIEYAKDSGNVPACN